MNARTPLEIVRHVVCTASRVRHASSTSVPQGKKAMKPSHGQQIFIYHHLQKNHVVYSLTKSLKNNASIRQLPYNGKKTVPATLRKDLWAPLATISFPRTHTALGLSTYQKLREYRRLHELSWSPSSYNNFIDPEGELVPKKKRGRLLCDQKANSVADIAAVLGKIGTPEAREIGLKGGESMVDVEVRWNDLGDAEYAATWSGNVVHDKLVWDRDQGPMTDEWYIRVRAIEVARMKKKEMLAEAERLRREEQERRAKDVVTPL